MVLLVRTLAAMSSDHRAGRNTTAGGLHHLEAVVTLRPGVARLTWSNAAWPVGHSRFPHPTLVGCPFATLEEARIASPGHAHGFRASDKRGERKEEIRTRLFFEAVSVYHLPYCRGSWQLRKVAC